VSDLFGKEGRRAIQEVEDHLPLDAQVELTSCMRLLGTYDEEIKALEAHLADTAASNPNVQLLMSIKGVSLVLALSIWAYIVDISRFPSAKKLASYAGIVPEVRITSGKVYHGPITKEGPPVLRWALVEAAQNLIREPGPFRNLYRRQVHRKGDNEVSRGKAVVACANKLARVIWKMLTDGKPYNSCNISLFEKKLGKVRKMAKPYQHSLEESWKSEALIPSRRMGPALREVENPAVARLELVHRVMEKARRKERRKASKKAA